MPNLGVKKPALGGCDYKGLVYMELWVATITGIVGTFSILACLGMCKFIFRRMFEDDPIFASVGIIAWIMLIPFLPILVHDLLT